MVYVNLPNEDVARNIVRRSILIKEIIDVIISNNNNYRYTLKESHMKNCY